MRILSLFYPRVRPLAWGSTSTKVGPNQIREGGAVPEDVSFLLCVVFCVPLDHTVGCGDEPPLLKLCQLVHGWNKLGPIGLKVHNLRPELGRQGAEGGGEILREEAGICHCTKSALWPNTAYVLSFKVFDAIDANTNLRVGLDDHRDFAEGGEDRISIVAECKSML